MVLRTNCLSWHSTNSSKAFFKRMAMICEDSKSRITAMRETRDLTAFTKEALQEFGVILIRNI